MSTEEIQTAPRFPVHRLEEALRRAVSRFEPAEYRELLRSRIFPPVADSEDGTRVVELTELDSAGVVAYCHRVISGLRIPCRCERQPWAGNDPRWGQPVKCDPPCRQCKDYDMHARALMSLIAPELDALEAELASGQAAEEIHEGERRPRCRWCGEEIPPARGPIAMYCRDSHRVAMAKNKKREADKKAAAAEGVTPAVLRRRQARTAGPAAR